MRCEWNNSYPQRLKPIPPTVSSSLFVSYPSPPIFRNVNQQKQNRNPTTVLSKYISRTKYSENHSGSSEKIMKAEDDRKRPGEYKSSSITVKQV